MDRREFLRLGAIAGAGALLAQCSSGSSKATRTARTTTPTTAPRAESLLESAPADSGIDTVVIAMMENRSFDSYMGWMARDEHYLETGRSRYGSKFAINGDSHQSFPDVDGTQVETYRRILSKDASPWRGCGHPDPGHQWGEGRAEFGQAGFRVPTVLASPYAQSGFVDHTLYDHTSILRFLEWRFLGAPARGAGADTDKWFLTPRDRHANNLGETLVRTMPNPELGFDPDVKIAAPAPACVTPEALRNVEPSAMEVAFERGYFDRIAHTY